MPVLIDLHDCKDPISLKEFLSHVDSSYFNPKCRNSLIEMAPYLLRLSYNRSFLTELLIEELINFDNLQKNNNYTSTVFIIKDSQKYIFRANIWRCLSQKEKLIDNFNYDVLHDHNFDILTVGYKGSGYVSETYEYNKDSTQKIIGDKADLTNKYIITLSQHKILLYRAKEDVHKQYPPKEFSISLNLIPRNNFTKKPQFQVDEEEHRIKRYLHTSSAELMIKLISLIGNKGNNKSLDRIISNNSSSYCRALAAVAKSTLEDDIHEEVMNSLLQEKNKYITRVFLQEYKGKN
ncbi:conserved hypothetical protein [Vibrio coralliirubri]|uniref:hypothetical protein n=1 Tax=Vibrio coralliirubri TaxID=1516159 RepID=UPI0006333BAC|nr:hypothetical protein [Vibrio coralliirubri]CDT46967.1 conserved hypothetical protein [Vibrio coralliirubri]